MEILRREKEILSAFNRESLNMAVMALNQGLMEFQTEKDNDMSIRDDKIAEQEENIAELQSKLAEREQGLQHQDKK